MTVSEFRAPPLFSNDETIHRKQLGESINNIIVGKMNNVIDVTLTASSATTTITVVTTSRVNGSAIVTNANNSQTDRTFKVIMVG